MKKQQYEIKMKDGTTRTVEGVLVGNWGIDKRQVNVFGLQTLSFFLTYIPTGALVTNAKTRKVLLEFINRSDVIEETKPAKIAKALKLYYDEINWKE